MITLKEYLMGRDVQYPLDDEQELNAQLTVRRVNQLLYIAGYNRGVRSGYRPAAINSKIPGAAPKSKHISCQAVDIEDNDGKLKSWCLKNLEELESAGIWMEAPEYTPTWCHLQTCAPLSGHRVFIP